MIFFLGDHMGEKIFAFKRVLYNGVAWFSTLVIEDNEIKIVLDNGKEKYVVARIQRPPKDVPLDVYKAGVPAMLEVAHTVVRDVIKEEEDRELEEYAIMIDEDYHYMKELGIIENDDFDEEEDF